MAFQSSGCLNFVDPLGYLDFLALEYQSQLVITDSGGIQEETTALNVPCITVRENTERPITIEEGTNRLVKIDKDEILLVAQAILNGKTIEGRCPDLWDGNASKRIVHFLTEILSC